MLVWLIVPIYDFCSFLPIYFKEARDGIEKTQTKYEKSDYRSVLCDHHHRRHHSGICSASDTY